MQVQGQPGLHSETLSQKNKEHPLKLGLSSLFPAPTSALQGLAVQVYSAPGLFRGCPQMLLHQAAQRWPRNVTCA
jgi:hypothetical protein